jgi:hypothetical protein
VDLNEARGYRSFFVDPNFGMNLGWQKTENKSQDKSNDEFRKVPTTKYLFWVFHSLAD